jgi:hypothetical protein
MGKGSLSTAQVGQGHSALVNVASALVGGATAVLLALVVVTTAH